MTQIELDLNTVLLRTVKEVAKTKTKTKTKAKTKTAMKCLLGTRSKQYFGRQAESTAKIGLLQNNHMTSNGVWIVQKI